ncbi:oligoendopeptidase F [Fictibacillus macauensis ZFHKF-1]|uniref:Oligoendopeptidase F n=1 Tax=Fictibacillus macauensis ZFHKF-1 TaxID=1196324 RepID=I8J3T7_9BACL|nr:hypothetical protein [Fictibacillus macauensis]EIT86431.1 oligoendopeptidase F [Fictibacillus macauensis ZFHKF-1]
MKHPDWQIRQQAHERYRDSLNHSPQERNTMFSTLMHDFKSDVMDYKDEQDWTEHFFESPFYFIEYGMAQIGAFRLYQQFKKIQPVCCNALTRLYL